MQDERENDKKLFLVNENILILAQYSIYDCESFACVLYKMRLNHFIFPNHEIGRTFGRMNRVHMNWHLFEIVSQYPISIEFILPGFS